MSLAPKIDEVNYFATCKNPDLICLTETWLTKAISENCINIPGYYLTCKNRSTGAHGGVCVYINNSIQYKTLDQLHHPELEVLWVYGESGWLSGYLSGLPPLRAGVQFWPRPACGLSFSRSQPDSRVFLRVLRFSSLIKIDSQLINI